MGPYRTPAEPPQREVMEREPVHDDRQLGWLLLVVGGVRVVIALAQHEVFAASASIALFMVAIGISLLRARSRPRE